MKTVKADLVSNVVGSYDQTKTTIQGRVASKVINSQTVLGPPLNKFLDVYTDTTTLTTTVINYMTSNGRIFNIGAEAAGTAYVSLHEIDFTTGATTYVGMIRISLPDTAATTHTYRSLKVIDTGTTGWKIFLSSTGTVAINGGTFLVNSIDKADFIPVGPPIIPFATGNNQKAVYFLQDSANIGVGQLQIATAGSVLDTSANKLYVHNGIAATHQYYVYDTSVAPTYTSASVSVSVASPGIVSDAGHSYAANTPVVFLAGTLPTGLAINTVYFVRNPIAGVSYELSATTGGASINTTGSPSVGAVLGRAFGTNSSNFLFKTGNLPALTGTLLLTDSEDFATPGHTVLSGFSCAFLSTTSNLYLGKLSELTVGAVTWPSLITVNILGAANEITAPTAVLATWSNVLDRAIYTTSANIFVMKQFVNSAIEKVFGNISNKYREGISSNTVALGFLTTTSLDVESGWLICNGTTVGQRGCVLVDLRSDQQFDHSYIVTKVIDTPASTYKFLSLERQLRKYAGDKYVEYRTSGFGSISGGWTALPSTTEDLSGVSPGAQVQFKIRFDTINSDTPCTHAQFNELFLNIESLSEISDYFEFSDDYSDNNTPSRSAFRLKKAYVGAVPTLYFRAHDLSDALLINNNTVTNAVRFEYSTDNGMTWLPLGTIPNVVGTLVRYTFSSPPGVDIRPSIRES